MSVSQEVMSEHPLFEESDHEGDEDTAELSSSFRGASESYDDVVGDGGEEAVDLRRRL
jgi:hypothetical protein